MNAIFPSDSADFGHPTPKADPWDFGALAVSTFSSAAILAFGLFFFRRTERLVANIV